MNIERHKVTVDFEIAYFQGSRDDLKTVSELNMLFHEMIKAWAKDHHVIATPTRTQLLDKS